jgi:threonine/homoserine/homoserine lactone efflux protein
MELEFLFKGLLIGLSIAAPVGPMGILCIRRTLAEGRLVGLISGLGVATADATYGCIAGFGLTFISDLLLSGQFWIRLIGGIFLCYLALKTFLAEPAKVGASAKSTNLITAYTSTFLLTLTNPTTILSFVAIFAGLGAGSTSGDYGLAAILVAGVFCGSALWWLILTTGISLFRSKFNLVAMRWVNRISGIIIGAFGILALLSLIKF